MAARKEGEGSVSEVHGLVLKGRHWNHGGDAAVGRETANADREEESGFFLLTFPPAKPIRESYQGTDDYKV